ncbi:DUF7511 domain-containing protein [Halopiger goleimassiliensis]|uniref:DUF7511 domain-containing protein n=1 Tax=Halopiger goleimassiliensis TaxID=1293048 RepID=UPI000A3DFAB1|nr:hypothetical protein [Halopiger goleimassiliensis]
MTDDVSDTHGEPRERDADGEPPLPDVSPCYEAYLERHDHRPDACTIYCSISNATARDQWIKAWGDGFVSREELR